MIAFIDMHREQFGVEAICRILGDRMWVHYLSRIPCRKEQASLRS